MYVCTQVSLLRSQPNQLHFLSCDNHVTVTIWLVTNGYPIKQQEFQFLGSIADAQFSPIEDRLALILYNGVFFLLSSQFDHLYWEEVILDDEEWVGTGATCCEWSPDGHVILVGTSVGWVHEVSLQGEVVSVTECSLGPISAIAWRHSDVMAQPAAVAVFTQEAKCIIVPSWNERKANTVSLCVESGTVSWHPSRPWLTVAGIAPNTQQPNVEIVTMNGDFLATMVLPTQVQKLNVVNMKYL